MKHKLKKHNICYHLGVIPGTSDMKKIMFPTVVKSSDDFNELEKEFLKTVKDTLKMYRKVYKISRKS